VVDILRFVSSYASIYVTVRVQFTNALARGLSHPQHGLVASNPFANVFGNKAILEKPNVRETTDAVEGRLQDRQAARYLARVT
jgi:hypothetical protein